MLIDKIIEAKHLQRKKLKLITIGSWINKKVSLKLGHLHASNGQKDVLVVSSSLKETKHAKSWWQHNIGGGEIFHY